MLVTRDDVWVAHRGVYGNLAHGYGGRKPDDRLGNNIGPEYAFGYFMGEAMDEQILLIKIAGGGTSLYRDWRPPSAGLPAGTKAEDIGGMYKALTKYTHEALDNLKKYFHIRIPICSVMPRPLWCRAKLYSTVLISVLSSFLIPLSNEIGSCSLISFTIRSFERALISLEPALTHSSRDILFRIFGS